MEFTAAVSLGVIGLVLGLIGSAALALSLDRVIAALSLATDAHNLAIEGLVAREGPVVRLTGTNIHVEAGRKVATRWTKFGLWLLVVSFGCQVAALLLPLLHPK